jgi:hypothetical protein
MLAPILNSALFRNHRLHVFPPAIIGMADAALALASVAFDVLALDGVQSTKDDPKGKRKNKEGEEDLQATPQRHRLVLSAQARTALR